jgi:hypothetical protein
MEPHVLDAFRDERKGARPSGVCSLLQLRVKLVLQSYNSHADLQRDLEVLFTRFSADTQTSIRRRMGGALWRLLNAHIDAQLNQAAGGTDRLLQQQRQQLHDVKQLEDEYLTRQQGSSALSVVPSAASAGAAWPSLRTGARTAARPSPAPAAQREVIELDDEEEDENKSMESKADATAAAAPVGFAAQSAAAPRPAVPIGAGPVPAAAAADLDDIVMLDHSPPRVASPGAPRATLLALIRQLNERIHTLEQEKLDAQADVCGALQQATKWSEHKSAADTKLQASASALQVRNVQAQLASSELMLKNDRFTKINIEAQLHKVSDENRAMLEARLCTICKSNQVNCFYAPCGHALYCRGCTQQWAQRGNTECPHCRCVFSTVHALYPC